MVEQQSKRKPQVEATADVRLILALEKQERQCQFSRPFIWLARPEISGINTRAVSGKEVSLLNGSHSRPTKGVKKTSKAARRLERCSEARRGEAPVETCLEACKMSISSLSIRVAFTFWFITVQYTLFLAQSILGQRAV